MFRKSKKIVIVAAAFFVVVTSFFVSFDSLAGVLTFNVNYAEPSTSDTQGYITVLATPDNGQSYDVFTYFWNTKAHASGYDSPSYMYITMTSNSITFRPAGTNMSTSSYFNLIEIDSEGKFNQLTSSSNTAYEYNWSTWEIRGWKGYGNIGYINSTAPQNSFTVNYNEDKTAQSLQEIVDYLYSNYYQNLDMCNKLQSILNSVDGVENQLTQVTSWLSTLNSNATLIDNKLEQLIYKANDILEEEQKQTTWLEKIFNWLQDSPEQEKQEAQTQGNQSTSEATSAITDNSQGFIDSLGGLANSMNYSGTECAWTFPAITIPAIPGVMDSYVLCEEQPIDFSYWVNQIPSSLLLLIQSLLTIALIIYCFKEVYGTISYVLTLRGGGSE